MGLGRVRRAVADLLAWVRRGGRADPTEFGFTDDAVAAMADDARGDTVTVDRLLGPTAKAPVLEHLRQDEQPHHLVPANDLAVEMDGEEMAADRGYLVVTDDRMLVLLYGGSMGLTVGRNEVEYGQVDTIERGDGGDPRELTVHTPARTLTVRTPEREWGSALEAAVDGIRERRP